jgi:hypothetical protein
MKQWNVICPNGVRTVRPGRTPEEAVWSLLPFDQKFNYHDAGVKVIPFNLANSGYTVEPKEPRRVRQAKQGK